MFEDELTDLGFMERLWTIDGEHDK